MRLGLLCGFIILLFANFAMAIEEPKYTLVEKFGEFELRAYAPKVLAETLVEGSLDDASSVGFRRIADYIFGNNRAHNGGNEKISMTAPVTTQQANGKWRMYFVMPSQYSLITLPTPNNPDVTLREMPATQMAVIRFSGLAGEEKIAKKTAELRAWLESKNIAPEGEPELARYNPPWSLPFLRRNEVMVRY
jgi:hypothetical protein